MQKAEAVSGSCLSLSELEKTRNNQQQEDHEKMNQARAQLMEWIIFEDYGTKDVKETIKKHDTGLGIPPFILHNMI